MTSWSERAAAGDAARAEAKWGMRYVDEGRAAPERLAWEAAQRGDTWFQVDLVVASYQGNIALGSSWSRVWRPEPYDHIGAVEKQGWSLHSVSTAYVSRGASINSGGTAEESIHGDLMALYVFRRS